MREKIHNYRILRKMPFNKLKREKDKMGMSQTYLEVNFYHQTKSSTMLYVSVGIRNGNFVHSEWIFLTDYNLKIQFESLEISMKCWVCFSKRFLYFCVSLS